MTTSVKMDDETRSCLERLQAEIWPKTGTRVTQQEVLVRLVEDAVEPKADLIDSFRGECVSLSTSEREWLHDGMALSGVTMAEEDIDDVLYG